MFDVNTQFKYTIFSLTGCYPCLELDSLEDALKTYSIDNMKETLNNGADIDMVVEQYRGYTAIFYAALYGRHDVLEELLKLGANPNIKDNNGMTVLHMLVEKIDMTVGNTFEAIGILLKYGARPDIRDNWKTTAYELAMDKKEGVLQKSFELALEKLDLQEQERKLQEQQNKAKKRLEFRSYIKNRNNKKNL